jgi:CheY-like chemotaxis protein
MKSDRWTVMTFRILVVDDNDSNLLLVTKILEMEGYLVILASNGVEALNIVKQHEPDLALLDVMMPDMDGYTLCRNLRQPPLNSHFPIIMLTAMNSEHEKALAREAGADEVWSKPFDIDVFRQQVVVLLARDRQIGKI